MKGPLAGIRVVDCTQWIQGSMVGVMLADMGADVIKIEEPQQGDQTRGWLQSGFGAQTHQVQRNYIFEGANRGKKSMTLNLRKQKGREILHSLIRKADIFVHNWRGENVPRKLGADYDTLTKVNPQLIYSHVSGWGPKGADSGLPAFEPSAQARAGMYDLFRGPDSPPVIFPGGPGDITGATLAVVGILAALEARRHLGKGQKVDTSLLGSILHLLTFQLASLGVAQEIYPQRSRFTMGNQLWNHYQCADGKWITFSMSQPDRFWHNFCLAVGIPELETDPRFENLWVRADNAKELIAILDKQFATKPRDEWLKQFKEAKVDLIYSPIQSIPEVFQDSQVLANEYLVDFDHPLYGPVKIIGVPYKFSETPAQPRHAAPELGQHTEEVLLELGYGWDKIAELKNEAVT